MNRAVECAPMSPPKTDIILSRLDSLASGLLGSTGHIQEKLQVIARYSEPEEPTISKCQDGPDDFFGRAMMIIDILEQAANRNHFNSRHLNSII